MSHRRHPQRKPVRPKGFGRAHKMSRKELLRQLRATLPEWTPFEAHPPEIPKVVGADEGWDNSRYSVWVYYPGNPRSPNDWNLRPDAPEDSEYPRFLHLSIKSHDRCHTAHDWRDLMRIKNELIHPEAAAVEVYPAMSCMMDTSNQFHLWVMVPNDFTRANLDEIEWPSIPVGYWKADISGPEVSETVFPKCKQRAFEDGFLAGYEHLTLTSDDLDAAIAKGLQDGHPDQKRLRKALNDIQQEKYGDCEIVDETNEEDE